MIIITCSFWTPCGFGKLKFVKYRDFSNLSIEVTFSNTSTNLLTMMYDNKNFKRTEFFSNKAFRHVETLAGLLLVKQGLFTFRQTIADL